jgi:hypothetical protein
MMRNRLDGVTVTLRGSGVDAHLVRARVQRPCSPSAHALAEGRSRNCGQTIRPGDVYVKVRTAAWPNPDSDMSVACAEEKGWVTRN